jgi:hypothetical protein
VTVRWKRAEAGGGGRMSAGRGATEDRATFGERNAY